MRVHCATLRHWAGRTYLAGQAHNVRQDLLGGEAVLKRPAGGQGNGRRPRNCGRGEDDGVGCSGRGRDRAKDGNGARGRRGLF
jgi:hypothetical protein